jgi:putative nucleotidyltransferase with HDIG domain
MRRADLALYEAKNAGRNCVKLWDKDMVRLLAGTDLEIEKIRHLRRRIVGLSEKAEKLFMESIWGLVQALEAKDPYARKHSENVMAYSVGIARIMELGPNYIDTIQRAAMIHDIGKIGVPDVILLKPDHLTPHERTVIEQHPVIAVRILEKMSFLEKEIPIVHHHHERWNGQGYPDGLARTAIPLGARIVAVADTFDALTSARAYHTSRSVAETLRILKDSAGYELDPTVVAAVAAWVENVGKQLDTPPDQLTAEDLVADFHACSAGQNAACSMTPEPAVP